MSFISLKTTFNMQCGVSRKGNGRWRESACVCLCVSVCVCVWVCVDFGEPLELRRLYTNRGRVIPTEKNRCLYIYCFYYCLLLFVLIVKNSYCTL